MKHNISVLIQFFASVLRVAVTGNRAYFLWMGSLTVLLIFGGLAYSVQFEQGLSATGLHDHVSWGFYIANFTFLIGVAAAAVMLVLPTYILKDKAFSGSVIVGEGLAVGALIMALCFVLADLGNITQAWHLTPVIGILNFPDSMLSWDVLVVNTYLILNLSIPFYILFRRFQDKEPIRKVYFPGVLLSMFVAVSIHMVTSFLYAGLVSRPLWNTALLGPRFLASAFTGGTALIILVLQVINRYSEYKTDAKTIGRIAIITTFAAQVNLIMLGSEFFKEFYYTSHHSLSAQYLFFGLEGKSTLVPWIWTAIVLSVIGTVFLSVHKLRRNFKYLNIACVFLFVGIWIEKGMGLIVPGFIPEPWGNIDEYSPTLVEVGVTVGIWALGGLIITTLLRPALLILTGKLRYKE